jgi:hypothetical protein
MSKLWEDSLSLANWVISGEDCIIFPSQCLYSRTSFILLDQINDAFRWDGAGIWLAAIVTKRAISWHASSKLPQSVQRICANVFKCVNNTWHLLFSSCVLIYQYDIYINSCTKQHLIFLWNECAMYKSVHWIYWPRQDAPSSLSYALDHTYRITWLYRHCEYHS